MSGDFIPSLSFVCLLSRTHLIINCYSRRILRTRSRFKTLSAGLEVRSNPFVVELEVCIDAVSSDAIFIARRDHINVALAVVPMQKRRRRLMPTQ